MLKRHLTVANVLSCMALFVALSGVAYAATLGKNQVKAKNIAKEAVTTPKLKQGAVTSPEAPQRSGDQRRRSPTAPSTQRQARPTTRSRGKQDSAEERASPTNKIAAQAVTTGKLGNEAVTTGKLSASLARAAGQERHLRQRESAPNNTEAAKTVTANCPPGKRRSAAAPVSTAALLDDRPDRIESLRRRQRPAHRLVGLRAATPPRRRAEATGPSRPSRSAPNSRPHPPSRRDRGGSGHGGRLAK